MGHGTLSTTYKLRAGGRTGPLSAQRASAPPKTAQLGSSTVRNHSKPPPDASKPPPDASEPPKTPLASENTLESCEKHRGPWDTINNLQGIYENP